MSWQFYFLIFFTTAIQSWAQNTELQAFMPMDSVPVPIIPKKSWTDPFIGNYTVGETGITLADGHTLYLRIAAPDMTKVIPMPGTDLQDFRKPQPLQQDLIPLRRLPALDPPAPGKQ